MPTKAPREDVNDYLASLRERLAILDNNSIIALYSRLLAILNGNIRENSMVR